MVKRSVPSGQDSCLVMLSRATQLSVKRSPWPDAITNQLPLMSSCTAVQAAGSKRTSAHNAISKGQLDMSLEGGCTGRRDDYSSRTGMATGLPVIAAEECGRVQVSVGGAGRRWAACGVSQSPASRPLARTNAAPALQRTTKMATGPKLVHKQFNSPIGLYSPQNIQETLNKHLSNLDNGTVGIDFSNPATGKPGNLANSAVLRMLEEEERTRKGLPGQKKVVWPPLPETNGYHSPQQQQSPAFYNNAQHSPQPTPQPPYRPQEAYPPQYQQPQYYQPPGYQQQTQPAYSEGKKQQPCGLSKLIPVGAGAPPAARPASPYLPGPPSPQPYRPHQTRWAPVSAPLSPQLSSQQAGYGPPQYPEPPQRPLEPPPTTITLRPQPPVHQRPPPVFASQPATASFRGGVNMRGDQKWPPQEVKEAVAMENEARRQLAKGPACRPRKVKKDYSSFFAQHALSHNYPGYRAPPGTQHYEDHSGRSSY